jgi:hypothetical protein
MALVTTYSNPVAREQFKTADITAAKTLVAGDSGTAYGLNAAAGVAVTLPALKAGLWFRFTTKAAFATTDFTIVSSTNVIEGNVLVAGVHVAGSNENTISFVATAESLGDWVEIYCDGTNWYASGSGVTTGSITFTAP